MYTVTVSKPWGPALAVALGCAAGNACLVELDHVFACGDGYVDRTVGEECDPNDESSYIDACPNYPNGHARCDPNECTIIADETQCADCGDGIINVEAGEECDGSNLGMPCWGAGSPTCTLDCKIDFSSCNPCGNGIVEGKEECDDGIGGGGGDDIVLPVYCAGTLTEEPLDPPFSTRPYTAGSTNRCLSSCTYDRRDCTYCGNGVREDAMFNSPFDSGSMTQRELCDEDDFDGARMASEFPLCASLGAWGNVDCNDDCLDWTPRSGPLCCVPPGSACPTEGSGLHCCYYYAHPEAESECLPVIVPSDGVGKGEGNAVVCR